MCEPVSWTAVAVGAATILATTATAKAAADRQASAATEADRQQAAAIQEDTRRKQALIQQGTDEQDALARQQQAALNQQQQAHDPATQQQQVEQATQARQELYKTDTDPTKQYLAGQSDAPAVVKGAIDSKIADTMEQVGGWNDAKARLNAWGDVGVKNAIADSGVAGTIGTLAGLRRGSLNVLGTGSDAIDANLTARQLAAQRAGTGAAGVANALTGASQLGAYYAGRKLANVDWRSTGTTNPVSSTENAQGGLF